MKMTITIPQDVEAKELHCFVAPRFWEDTSVNDEWDDEEGSQIKKLFPSLHTSKDEMTAVGVDDRTNKEYDFLHLIIDLDNGCIKNWDKGNKVKFGYKSCDINIFVLTGKDGNTIFKTPSAYGTEYVIGPNWMNEWGDYFVLQVNEEGEIQDWNENTMKASIIDWINHWVKDEMD